ncbi:hypothetical protein D8674_026939 [Pyrus ussuriensis x Pyrus communis]|uniref:Uncharacterized protein n=1 Tax=Pyrus ussuriensis x Pyrus communis TaxID=2448454 RepID=A0A5N5I897_9ROSA|nr:hypothetical protein D8674_026939 [Pyrus ussuriensis x Pyrus communis]
MGSALCCYFAVTSVGVEKTTNAMHRWTGRYEAHLWENRKVVDSQEGLQCTEELHDVINMEDG